MSELESPPPTPEQHLFEQELSRNGLIETARAISNICNQDIGISLTATRERDERRHWEAAMWLAGIIFDNPVQAHRGKETKPWEYRIDIQTTNIDGEEETRTMNARMVGQTLQKLFAFAEVWRHHGQSENPTDRDKRLIDTGFRITRRHFEEVVEKYKLSLHENAQGKSDKKTLDELGLSSVAGVDKASPKEILFILNTLKRRSENTSKEERQKINKTLLMFGVLLPRLQKEEILFHEGVTKSRHLTEHKD
jgi:hypothetical protein